MEEEFMFDVKTKLRFDQLKRAKYDEISQNNTNSTSSSREERKEFHTINSGGAGAGG
jgi:hypothetical protein